jgi:multicomponent Na+:H+ antiporter subunit D
MRHFSAFLPLLVSLPLVTAVFVVLLHRLPRRLLDVLCLLSTSATVVLTYLLSIGVTEQKMIVYRIAGWPQGLGITMVADGLSSLLLLIVNVLIFLLVIYSTEFIEQTGKWHFYGLFMFMQAGLNGVLVAGDFFNLYVFIEMTVISAYVLAAFERRAESFEASFKYAVLGSLSSLLILLALAFLYAATGSLNMAAIAAAWNQGQTPLGIAVILLLLVGFGLKSTLVPFHAWVPDAYSAAPAPASAAFAGTVSKVLGVYLLVRFFFNVIGIEPVVLHILALLGVVSILVAVTLALFQWDFKRLLAYHSISQLGYIVLGIGLGTPLGILGGLFHLLNHSIFKSLLFMNAGSVEYATGKRNLKEMGGVAQKMPVTGMTSMIASLSISGVPPLNGFWSKLIIIVACVQAGRYTFAVCAVVGSILTLSSFMKVQRYVFMGYLKDTLSDIKEVPLAMTLPMLVLAAFCIFAGVLLLSDSEGNILMLALDAVLRGKEYGSMVMGLLQ